jgi:hypothetical protein
MRGECEVHQDYIAVAVYTSKMWQKRKSGALLLKTTVPWGGGHLCTARHSPSVRVVREWRRLW